MAGFALPERCWTALFEAIRGRGLSVEWAGGRSVAFEATEGSVVIQRRQSRAEGVS